MPDGLFPTDQPKIEEFCPTVFWENHIMRRPLTLSEACRVYQVPLKYDADLKAGFRMCDPLPFESVPSPYIFADIM